MRRTMWAIAGCGCLLVSLAVTQIPTVAGATGRVLLPGYTVVTSATIAAGAEALTTASVTCPVVSGTQTVPLGGGADVTSSDLLVNIRSSWPTDTAWNVVIDNASDSLTSFTVSAVCAKEPADYSQPEANLELGTGPQQGTSWNGCGPSNGKILVTGGGGAVAATTGGVGSIDLTSTFPPGDVSWQTWMDNDTGADASINFYDVCAKLSKAKTGYTIVSASTSAAAGAATVETVKCPAGLSPLGGGEYNSVGVFGANIQSSYPVAKGWTVVLDNNSASSGHLSSIVTCAK